MSVKIKTIYEMMKCLTSAYPNSILMFKAGAMVQVFDEDAILLNRLLAYKINLLGSTQSYLRVGFPLNIIDKVVKQIKFELKLPVAFFLRDKESSEMVLEKEYSLKTQMQKSDYVNHGDLVACISEIKANEKQVNKIIVSKNSLRKNDGFHLHSKMLKLFVFISASITRYMPRVYKGSLGQSYLNEWVLAMKQINLLRNIPGYM